MNLLGRISVFPALPARLSRLDELAHNLWWSWNHEAQELFRFLDADLWERIYHNPVKLLSLIDQRRLESVARDEAFLARFDAVMAHLDAYLNPESTWFADTYANLAGEVIAYFSAEFGLHESLPIYSGGLGILSGDHCKSASDLGIPLVGVGLLYNQGYFRQKINAEGGQEAVYERLQFAELPIQPASTPEGHPAIIGVELPGRTVWAKIWEVRVGRVKIYLLDTDIEQNTPVDRGFSAKLYGGDQEMRIAQEVILGIGGVRALRALGLRPAAYHQNEGHSAFSGLERLRELVQDAGLSFDAAREAVAATTIFTTHTPVPAGNDAFGFDLIDRVFSRLWPKLGIGREEFLALARSEQPDGSSLFSMTILALRLAKRCNGVSRLHGQVSREIWKDVWPGVPVGEIPIGSITNGIHTETWVAPEILELYTKFVGSDWRFKLATPEAWDGIRKVPDAELWAVRRQLKERLIGLVRERVKRQRLRNGDSTHHVAAAEHLLDPDALTIGFARRFATYKRATLMFRDMARMARILGKEGRPVQFLFAGKAHPADGPGKELIRQVSAIAAREEFEGRIVFLEDYDIQLARHLVQGVDIWLNTPRRPLEASGTSGQKAAANGVLNASILDGWWPEGFDGLNGWAIGEEREYRDPVEQDDADAVAIYELLENEIVPLYYGGGPGGVSSRWCDRVRDAIATLTPLFSTHRMLQDYTNELYTPTIQIGRSYADGGFELARKVSAWKGMMSQLWESIRIEAPAPAMGRATIGQEIELSARLHIGTLDPANVSVEICHGPLQNGTGTLSEFEVVPMRPQGEAADGDLSFSGKVVLGQGGSYGVGVRVIPEHPALVNKHELGLIRWA